jgi:hypothetical protein
MPLETYHYHLVDSGGRLKPAELFEAENDADAITKVQARHPQDRCEIWHGQRLVSPPERYPPRDVIAGSQRTIAEARRILREAANLVTTPLSNRQSDSPIA